ncbi:hypothetical protein [Streptomyces paromomycinus]|uniref:Uncharacterized protein n=1 Tax=Streptomyces paromomycinus TaxID=92743 RepID=A0A401WBF3_STREY|nr:hypothetical protein [Streptomyces paromomycinus]GCD46685.1 hypothetical protein GKJPGBOP_06436 [Streptomyces paromomycinus]
MSQPDAPEPVQPAPTTAEEALAAARARFEVLDPEGNPAPLQVAEFDLGFLVHAVMPPPPPGIQAPLGGSHMVISKIDGAVTYVPNFPPDSAIELYRSLRRPPG